MASDLKRQLTKGIDAEESLRHSAQSAFRPILTTALVAAVGFVPMAVSTRAGAEVQRPLATVVIGGIFSSTLLMLLVLPVLLRWIAQKSGKKDSSEAPLRPADTP